MKQEAKLKDRLRYNLKAVRTYRHIAFGTNNQFSANSAQAGVCLLTSVPL